VGYSPELYKPCKGLSDWRKKEELLLSDPAEFNLLSRGNQKRKTKGYIATDTDAMQGEPFANTPKKRGGRKGKAGLLFFDDMGGENGRSVS